MKAFRHRFLAAGFLAGCLIPVVATGAATYYVDQAHLSASDSNAGGEDKPFLTIGKGVSVAQPGDTVVVKEGLYRENVMLSRSGTAERPITLKGADGRRVIVSGADEVTGWTQCTQEVAKGNPQCAHIYYADIGWKPPHLYQDDVPLMKAREPNAGWFLAQGGTGTTLVDAANLTQADDTWVGAEIFLVDRKPSSNYTRTITDFVQSTHALTVDKAWDYERVPAAGDPYYLRNKVELLDGEGQWAVEQTGGEQYRVYVWPFGGGDPDGRYMMEATSTRRRFVIDLKDTGYWVIDGLEVRHGRGHGVGEWTRGGPGHNTIRNCSIHHNGGTGIHSRYNGHMTCRRNLVAHNVDGIKAGSGDPLIEENEIAHNEVDGVVACGENVTLRRNYIHDQWYWHHPDNFQCHGGQHNLLFEENLMVHAAQTIMMDKGHGVTFRGNVMMGAHAYMLVFSRSTPPTDDVTIESNTLCFSGYGLINMRADTVRLKNNIFFKGHGGALWSSSSKKDFASDYNLFYHADGIDEPSMSTVGWDGSGYTVAGYAAASGHDTHSAYGNPRFANAPVCYIGLSRGTRNESLPNRVYLRDAREIGHLAVGDHVEIDFDGVVRTVTAVGADYIDFEPGDWRITWRYGCLANWKASDNFALDMTLQPDSPAKGAGEDGADMGSPINVRQFMAGDFDGDGVRDIPAWPAVQPVKITDAKDRQIVEDFLKHTAKVPEWLSLDRCKETAAEKPTDFCWVILPQASMLLTAYETTGDLKYLDLFVETFANMRAAMTKGPDGYLGWYGKAHPVFFDPEDPDRKVDNVITGFRAVAVLARFLELAAGDPDLSSKYARQRTEYLDLMEHHMVRKWDARGNCVDLGKTGAVYRAHAAYKPTRAHLTLPHNMHSIIVRGLLPLYRVTGKDEYMTRAVKLGTRFKRCLTLKDGHYQWNYWDPAGAWDVHPSDAATWKHWIGPEHTGAYYSSTLSQAVVLYHHGVVFDKTDIERFVKTQTEVVWNGDLENPRWARADGSVKEKYTQGPYMCVDLAPFSEKVYRFLFTGARQDERVERAGHSWQGGPVADGWIRGKLITCPAAAGGRQVHLEAGKRFLAEAENRAFLKSLEFEVTGDGYRPPVVPTEMKPMPPEPRQRDAREGASGH